ncbi:helix-turn-helix transcriptional regulator [Crossiella cryophila]|uniref:Putative DNA-binding transcriptional regulator YafY n=1 Tax=Crossiella cryophila TaxID=43355 RepID=A0A7W7FXU9_9PSEU|nr:YafY family protein [Crossiella cryophila]MBB4679359.1 putative DNA-binding transcriptional regulator YafY [Crossiella cryophila]
MSHPTTRILALLELLQAHHRLTGADLAQRLDVDERTIRRYATRLAELGIPVQAERGRYGGYRLLPGYKLPPLMFTDEEAVAVILGLLAGARLGLATTAPAVDTALAKIQRVLPAQLRERTAAVREALDFTLAPRQAQAPGTGTLLVLGEATSRRRPVRLTYRSYQGQDSERELDPYGLVFHHGRWYVTGYDHHRADLRTFRLDRIGEVTITEHTFTPPAEFNPVQHVTQSLAGVPYAWEVQVTLHTTLDEARKRIPASTATLTDTADGVLLRTRAERLDGMAMMLAGLGWNFRIHHPAELKEEVRAHAARLVAASEH